MADNGKAKAKAKAKTDAPPPGAPLLGQQQQQPAVQQQVDPAEALAAFQAVIAQQQQQLAQQGALMQQLLDRQLEMEDTGNGGNGGFAGGYGGGNTERARQSKVEPPPSFSGTPSGWEEWKRRLQEWEVRFFDLDVREKPSLLMACLSGEALGLARSTVPTAEELGNPASFRKILNALEAQYSLRKGIRRPGIPQDRRVAEHGQEPRRLLEAVASAARSCSARGDEVGAHGAVPLAHQREPRRDADGARHGAARDRAARCRDHGCGERTAAA